jgi:hypothetical protein
MKKIFIGMMVLAGLIFAGEAEKGEAFFCIPSKVKMKETGVVVKITDEKTQKSSTLGFVKYGTSKIMDTADVEYDYLLTKDGVDFYVPKKKNSSSVTLIGFKDNGAGKVSRIALDEQKYTAYFDCMRVADLK